MSKRVGKDRQRLKRYTTLFFKSHEAGKVVMILRRFGADIDCGCVKTPVEVKNIIVVWRTAHRDFGRRALRRIRGAALWAIRNMNKLDAQPAESIAA